MVHPTRLRIARADKVHLRNGQLSHVLLQLLCRMPAGRGDAGDATTANPSGHAMPAPHVDEDGADEQQDEQHDEPPPRIFHYAETPHEISLILDERDTALVRRCGGLLADCEGGGREAAASHSADTGPSPAHGMDDVCGSPGGGSGVLECAPGYYRALQVLDGDLGFETTGIVERLAAPLADAAVPLFYVSTFLTDFAFVRECDLGRALAALRERGIELRDEAGDEVFASPAPQTAAEGAGGSCENLSASDSAVGNAENTVPAADDTEDSEDAGAGVDIRVLPLELCVTRLHKVRAVARAGACPAPDPPHADHCRLLPTVPPLPAFFVSSFLSFPLPLPRTG